MRQEAAMAYFKALSQYLLGGREECMKTGQTAKGQTMVPENLLNMKPQ